MSELTFSPRERQVAALLVDGQSHIQMAAELGISRSTVKTYVHRLYTKTGTSDRGALIFALIRAGAVAPPNLDLSLDGIKRRFRETADVTDPYYPEMGKITPGERLYLDAFMRFMRTPPGSDAEAFAEREREACLSTLLIEKRIPWWRHLPSAGIPHAVRLQLAATITGYRGMSREIGERFVEAYQAA